ncbi:hypothetical protein V1478_017900 [Vespula squamosa]|uniref:Uncharacterized protein n=1 Tax=Vespula squamosa TaxID=30214 RepID=A0ABD1ZW08_VESSQ
MGNSQGIMSTDPGQPFITDLHRDKKRILHNRCSKICITQEYEYKSDKKIWSVPKYLQFAGTGWSVVAIKDPNENE